MISELSKGLSLSCLFFLFLLIFYYFNLVSIYYCYILFLTALMKYQSVQSVQSLSRVQLFATPRTTACQPCLSITNSRSLLKLVSIESVMPSNYPILCSPLLLLPSIFPSTRVFSNESVLHIRWPRYWSSSFSNSLSNEYSGLISFRIDWFDLLVVIRHFGA